MTLKRYLVLAFVALGIVTLVLFPELLFRSGDPLFGYRAIFLGSGLLAILVFWSAVAIVFYLICRALWRLGRRP